MDSVRGGQTSIKKNLLRSSFASLHRFLRSLLSLRTRWLMRSFLRTSAGSSGATAAAVAVVVAAVPGAVEVVAVGVEGVVGVAGAAVAERAVA